jgi:hypothetical protein
MILSCSYNPGCRLVRVDSSRSDMLSSQYLKRVSLKMHQISNLFFIFYVKIRVSNALPFLMIKKNDLACGVTQAKDLVIQYTKRAQCPCYCLPRHKSLSIGVV